MALTSRLSVAIKGSILWVLISSALGLLPWIVAPNDATVSIPWIVAAFGLIGAGSHALVIIVKPEPFHMKSSVAMVASLTCCIFLALTYLTFGAPPELLKELLRILTYSFVPAVAVSYAVLRLLQRPSEA